MNLHRFVLETVSRNTEGRVGCLTRSAYQSYHFNFENPAKEMEDFFFIQMAKSAVAVSMVAFLKRRRKGKEGDGLRSF